MFNSTNKSDLDFVRDCDAAIYDRPSRLSTVFLFFFAALLGGFGIWAHLTEIEEVTRGEGQIIPTGRKQVIQSLEGGIVEDILVRQGSRVKKNQILLRIDDTRFASDLGGVATKAVGLRVQISRLGFEAAATEGSTVDFPDELRRQAPDVVSSEQRLFEIRKKNLANQLGILRDRLLQRQLELEELQETQKASEDALRIAKREYALKAPLANEGILSKTDILQLEREISELTGKIATAKKSIPRIQSAIAEAIKAIEEQELSFRQSAQSELNARLVELAVVEQSISAAQDRVVRTELRSPVDGIVNKLHVNTIGGVVRAGEPLVEITPIDDSLLAEVRISPKDIAFISPNQNATIKISAYDYTIYGVLDGHVDVISADSVIDESTRDSYYLVTIKTNQSYLRKGNENLPIIPGMVATADVITGKKSVLDYILKPIIKARHEALRER